MGCSCGCAREAFLLTGLDVGLVEACGSRSAFLRIAAVRQNGRLVGVVPFFAREEGMG
jgi:hypothetical protein